MSAREFVMHYYRLLPATTVTYGGGGSLAVAAGWYNLPTFIKAIDDAGTVDMTWYSATNEVSSTGAFTLSHAYANSLLGWPAGGGSKSTTDPASTWVPGRIEYLQEFAPIDVAGKKGYDSEFYLAQSGETWALGSVSINRERFQLALIRKYDMFTGLTGGVSAPFVDTVYRPDLGIVFELKWAASIDWATGYTQGGIWCHTSEPESSMQMPPWDEYYAVTMEANKYVV